MMQCSIGISYDTVQYNTMKYTGATWYCTVVSCQYLKRLEAGDSVFLLESSVDDDGREVALLRNK
jgi:hypothetical protein